MRECAHVCVCVCVYVCHIMCVCVCVCVCVYVCYIMCVTVCVCVCVYVYACVCVIFLSALAAILLTVTVGTPEIIAGILILYTLTITRQLLYKN